MKQNRRRRIEPLTVCAAIVFGYGLLTVNVYPQTDWGTENFRDIDGTYEHGWPVSYMSRELDAYSPHTNTAYYGPWPFGDLLLPSYAEFGLPPLIEFRPGWLAFDVIVSCALLLFSVVAVHSLIAGRELRLQFAMRHCLALIAFTSVCLAIAHAFDALVVSLILVIALLILPKLSVMLCLFVSGAQIIRMIRRHFARRGFPDRRPR